MRFLPRTEDSWVSSHKGFMKEADYFENMDNNKAQYSSIEGAIKAHAEEYSFNIESMLFPQLTKEQQKLWRNEIEQAYISGANAGVSLARDLRYKENNEYIRIDDFIEKACEFISKHIESDKYVSPDEESYRAGCPYDYFETSMFIEDFKADMKGE